MSRLRSRCSMWVCEPLNDRIDEDNVILYELLMTPGVSCNNEAPFEAYKRRISVEILGYYTLSQHAEGAGGVRIHTGSSNRIYFHL